jgi:hypothetical protein
MLLVRGLFEFWFRYQVGLSMKTKEFHARKIGQGDVLFQVGDIKLENLTLDDFKKAMATPMLGMEGYNVALVFRRANGQQYRLPGEAMRVHVLKETPEPLPFQAPSLTQHSAMSATLE